MKEIHACDGDLVKPCWFFFCFLSETLTSKYIEIVKGQFSGHWAMYYIRLSLFLELQLLSPQFLSNMEHKTSIKANKFLSVKMLYMLPLF